MFIARTVKGKEYFYRKENTIKVPKTYEKYASKICDMINAMHECFPCAENEFWFPHVDNFVEQYYPPRRKICRRGENIIVKAI